MMGIKIEGFLTSHHRLIRKKEYPVISEERGPLYRVKSEERGTSYGIIELLEESGTLYRVGFAGDGAASPRDVTQSSAKCPGRLHFQLVIK